MYYEPKSKRIYRDSEEAKRKYKWDFQEQQVDFYKYADDDEPTPFD